MFRLYRLDTGTLLQPPEHTVALLSQWSPWKILTDFESYPIPVSYLAARVSTLVAFDTFTLRLHGVIFGVAGVALMAWYGRRIAGPGVGLVAAALMATSPFHVACSQNAKFYTAQILLALVTLAVLHRAMRSETRWPWVAFAAVTTVGVLNHLFAALLVCIQVVVVVALLAPGWLRREKLARARLLRLAWSLLLAFLLYLPWLVPLADSFRYTKVGGGADGSGEVLADYLATISSLAGANGGLLLAFGAVSLLGLASAWRRRPVLPLLVVVGLILPPVVLLLARQGKNLRQEYLAFLLPLVLLAMAAGIVTLGRACARLAPPRARTLVAIAVATSLCCGVARHDLPTLYTGYHVGTHNACSAAAAVQRGALMGEGPGAPEAALQAVEEARMRTLTPIPDEAWAERHADPEDRLALTLARAARTEAWSPLPPHLRAGVDDFELHDFRNATYEVQVLERGQTEPPLLRKLGTRDASPLGWPVAALERWTAPDRVGARQQLLLAHDLLTRGRKEEAEQVAHEIVVMDATSSCGPLTLALAQLQHGNRRGALEALLIAGARHQAGD